MSKASQIIVLCEDKAHEMFVRRFLKTGWCINPRALRVQPYPNGKDSGKKFVIEQFNTQVKAFRSRATHTETILIVVRDADENSVEQAVATLDENLDQPRRERENIVYIIPKWHTETWIAYLDGNKVDESDKRKYKDSHGDIAKTKQAHPLIDGLVAKCKAREGLTAPPPSLLTACEEFERIRNILSE